MKFTLKFKYGSILAGSQKYGAPPKLCADGSVKVLAPPDDMPPEEYVRLGDKAWREMHELCKKRCFMRSTGCPSVQTHWKLCLHAYLMQEYYPNGREHPLYIAVTQAASADFQAGIEAYFAENK